MKFSKTFFNKALVASGLLLALPFSSLPAQADGFHYQISMSTRFIADAEGKLSVLGMGWTYDADVSAALIEESEITDANRVEVLKGRASDILADLFDLGYFSQLAVGGEPVDVTEVEDYGMVLGTDGRLTLSFQLPLVDPVSVKGKKVSLRMADPDGVGTLSYVNAQQVSLDATLAAACSSPSLTQETVTLPGDHKLTVPTAAFECRP